MTKDALKTVIVLFIFSILSVSVTAHAGENDEHHLTIGDVLEEIRTDQNVKSNMDINPDKVSDALLEELGEAVMNVQHPDNEEHEFMDNMMGGEDSKSLEAMHKWMGYNYLRNGYRIDNYYRGYGMMGPMMMNVPQDRSR